LELLDGGLQTLLGLLQFLLDLLDDFVLTGRTLCAPTFVMPTGWDVISKHDAIGDVASPSDRLDHEVDHVNALNGLYRDAVARCPAARFHGEVQRRAQIG